MKISDFGMSREEEGGMYTVLSRLESDSIINSDDISLIILQSNTQSHALVIISIVNMKHDWLQ